LRPVIYPRAGKITLVRYGSNGALDLTDPANFIGANGTVQMITPSVEIATTDLADGNSDFPMGVYDTGKNGTLQVTMSSFQQNLYAALMGTEKVDETNQNMWAAEEEKTVPDSTPFTVKLDHEVAAGGTIVVLNNDGSPLVSTDSSPASGEFTVSSDTLTFNSADAGLAVFVTYEHQAATSERIYLPTVGSRPVLHAIISTIATSEDETQTFDANIIVDKCKATGAMAPPPQQKEPQPWNFTLRILKPRGGYNPIYWRHAPRA
jgi:hypothetical protein